jgi:hypothetical protein
MIRDHSVLERPCLAEMSDGKFTISFVVVDDQHVKVAVTAACCKIVVFQFH